MVFDAVTAVREIVSTRLYVVVKLGSSQAMLQCGVFDNRAHHHPWAGRGDYCTVGSGTGMVYFKPKSQGAFLT